jgi:hypothetical protein
MKTGNRPSWSVPLFISVATRSRGVERRPRKSEHISESPLELRAGLISYVSVTRYGNKNYLRSLGVLLPMKSQTVPFSN